MDKSIDDWVDPCSAEIWEEPRDEYHHYDHHDNHRDDGNDGPGQFWTKLMSNDKVSFAFEPCYDSYPMKILEIHSSYHCCDFPSKMKL